MFEGIYKLPAGCILVCDGAGRPRVERYWTLRYAEGADRSLRHREQESWQRRLEEALRAAVERRLESEVPMGFLLSGGVDSASVFALGARASQEPVDAFHDRLSRRSARRVCNRRSDGAALASAAPGPHGRVGGGRRAGDCAVLDGGAAVHGRAGAHSAGV